MEYSKIIAITGLPGLYELISSKSDGGIVRSLDDKSTRFVSSRVHQFSHLESIEVYTTRQNVNLVDILKAMESSKESLPDEKDSKELNSYFEKVYPELDFERVYASDLKKMVRWFSVLSKNQVEIKLSEPTPEEETEEVIADQKDEKPAKKSSESKAKSAGDKKPAKKAEEEKQAKTTASKPAKKADTKKEEEKTAKKPAAKKDSAPESKGSKKPTSKASEKKPAAKKK